MKLYLPKADHKDEPSHEIQQPIADLRGSEVILLVEDNDLVRELAKSQLVDLGYRVLEATNGKEALQVIQERTDIVLLFTDVIMPGGMNGSDLAQEACRLIPALKVLYSSGYAENAIVHQGLLDKDLHLLSKPYSRLDLARKLREVLSES